MGAIMDINAETQNIQSHIDKGNFHAGMNLAISAMNECRRIEDQDGVDYFIDVIKGIADTISTTFGSQ